MNNLSYSELVALFGGDHNHPEVIKRRAEEEKIRNTNPVFYKGNFVTNHPAFKEIEPWGDFMRRQHPLGIPEL